MEEAISEILGAAVQAPSGGNSQPWQFRIRESTIELIALPEKDHPILNFRNRGTFVAHGALLENLLIAASKFGYRGEIELFPGEDPNFVARVNLIKAPPEESPLHSAIFLRATNRKSYKDHKLGLHDEQELRSSIDQFGMVKVEFVTDSAQLKTLGRALSTSEIVMFENRTLHKLFFNELVWTTEEEKRKKCGLYLKTMELESPQQKALRLFRYWPIMSLCNKFGFARFIAASNAKIYGSASVMCGIIIEPKDENFVSAGRAMERLWLQATKMGLSGHLITGVPFFWQRISSGEFPELASRHVAEVKKAYQDLASVFRVGENRLLAMVLRLGEADLPSARSSRLPPSIIGASGR